MLLLAFFIILKIINVICQYDEQDVLSSSFGASGSLFVGTPVDSDDFDRIWQETMKNYTGSDENKLTKWLKEYNDAREKWVNRKKSFKLTRAYPFCVDGKLPDDTEDPQLAKYTKFLGESAQPSDGFTKISNAKGFIETNGGDDMHDQNVYIGEIYFQSIYSPDNNVAPNMVRGIGRLNQWMHIVVKTVSPDVKLEGLYIQAISGPLGLPFGQFRVDFDCKSDMEDVIKETAKKATGGRHYGDYQAVDVGFNNNDNYDYKIRDPERAKIDPIVPCKYKPATAVRHPNVYAYNGRNGDNLPAKNIFRVHFNWEDLPCTNAASMQFLILAVRSFDASASKASVFRTPIYTQEIDSGDGVPYPYHPIWRKAMKCTGNLLNSNTADAFKLKIGQNSKSQMVYNYEYDHCVTEKLGLIKGTRICPPGPFKCTRASIDDTLTNQQLLELFKKNTNDDAKRTSVPCFIKLCPDPAETEPVIGNQSNPDVYWRHLQEDITKHAFGIAQRARGSHAASMTLAWGLAISVGAFIARYFKEIVGLTYNGGNGCLGIGCWLWVHIAVYYAVFALMWSSIIQVSHVRSNGAYQCQDFQEYFGNQSFSNQSKEEFTTICGNREKAIQVHKGFGWTSVVLFHTTLVTGWIRPWNDATRTILLYLHFVTGYGGKLMAFVSVLVLGISKPTVCSDIFVEYVLQEILMVAFFVGTHFFQRLIDKRTKVEGRKVFPVIEGIEVPDTKRPGYITNFVFMIGTFVVQLIIILAVYLSYTKMTEGSTSTDGLFDVFSGFLAAKDCQLPSKMLTSNLTTLKYFSKTEYGVGKFRPGLSGRTVNGMTIPP